MASSTTMLPLMARLNNNIHIVDFLLSTSSSAMTSKLPPKVKGSQSDSEYDWGYNDDDDDNYYARQARYYDTVTIRGRISKIR